MRQIRKALLILTLSVFLPAAAVAAVPECFPPDVLPENAFPVVRFINLSPFSCLILVCHEL